MKHHNFEYSGGIPRYTGDRYYGQDRARDFWAGFDKIGEALTALVGTGNFYLRGGDVTEGSSVIEVDIPVQFALVKYQVTIPQDYDTLPPPTEAKKIRIPVETEAETDFDISAAGATLDGVTVNYLKLAYAETDGDTRTKAKIIPQENYPYERIPGYTFTCDSAAPTDTEVTIAEIVSDGVASPAITMESPKNLDTVGETVNTELPVMHLQHEVPDGGDVSNSAGVNTVPINTEHINTIPGASFNAGARQFTLPAGLYDFFAWQRLFYVNNYAAYLWNVTDGEKAIVGSHGYADVGAPFADSKALVTGILEIDAEKTFEFRIYCQSAYSEGFSWNTPSADGNAKGLGDVVIKRLEVPTGQKGEKGDQGPPGTINATGVDVLDIVRPVGSFYTQYPAADDNDEAVAFPSSERPNTLFPGTTWIEQFETESLFFRTAGTDADLDRVDGLQDHALEQHQHYHEERYSLYASGVRNRGHTPAANLATTAGVNGVRGVHSANVSTETRPVNRLIKVWKRTA